MFESDLIGLLSLNFMKFWRKLVFCLWVQLTVAIAPNSYLWLCDVHHYKDTSISWRETRVNWKSSHNTSRSHSHSIISVFSHIFHSINYCNTLEYIFTAWLSNLWEGNVLVVSVCLQGEGPVPLHNGSWYRDVSSPLPTPVPLHHGIVIQSLCPHQAKSNSDSTHPMSLVRHRLYPHLTPTSPCLTPTLPLALQQLTFD